MKSSRVIADKRCPFTDGNGRTGRALVQGMSRNKGLTRQVAVPVSALLLADTDGYIAALIAYRQGNATPIVERFAEASARATANGRQLVTELRARKLERPDHRPRRLGGVEGRRPAHPAPGRQRRAGA